MYSMIHELSIGIVVLKPIYQAETLNDFEFVYLNALAEELYQAKSEQSIGAYLLRDRPDLQNSDSLMRYRNVISTGKPQDFEQCIRRENSSPESDRWYAIKAQSYEGFLVLLIEHISKRKKLEQHIQQLAFQDELTGIYNRRYFLSRTPQLLSLARRFDWSCALIYFDLNGFKAVNDTFGHSMGDKLLTQLAWKLSQLSREQDIFFRSGGDEFALFLAQASQEAAFQTASRIAQVFYTPLAVDGQCFDIGASIGIAVMPAKEASIDSLLERADSAMYQAKAQKQLERVPIVFWEKLLAPDESR